MGTPSSLIEFKEVETRKVVKTNPELPFIAINSKGKSKEIKKGKKASKSSKIDVWKSFSKKNHKESLYIQETESQEFSSD